MSQTKAECLFLIVLALIAVAVLALSGIAHPGMVVTSATVGLCVGLLVQPWIPSESAD